MNEVHIRPSRALKGKVKVLIASDTLEGLEREETKLRLKYANVHLGEPMRATTDRWVQFGTAWSEK